MSLQQASFGTLRRRFEAAADRHSALYCMMVERSNPSDKYAEFPNAQPNLIDPVVLSGGTVVYAEPTIVGNEVRPGSVREWKTYGTRAGMRTFDTLATEAGRLVVSEHLSTCDRLAAETLNETKYQERWLWALFDLAWSPAAGSPLQATRWAWWKNVRIPLDQVDEQRRVWGAKLETPIGLALAFIPDPPDSFCSVLEDLFSASVYAIDRLVQDLEGISRLFQAQSRGATGEAAKKPVRRKRRQTEIKELTPRQTEVAQIVAECKGNIAEAARRLGRDRKTVAEHYEKAMKKLGVTVAKPKTTALPQDHRGQSDVADHDEGPAGPAVRARVRKDRRR